MHGRVANVADSVLWIVDAIFLQQGDQPGLCIRSQGLGVGSARQLHQERGEFLALNHRTDPAIGIGDQGMFEQGRGDICRKLFRQAGIELAQQAGKAIPEKPSLIVHDLVDELRNHRDGHAEKEHDG